MEMWRLVQSSLERKYLCRYAVTRKENLYPKSGVKWKQLAAFYLGLGYIPRGDDVGFRSQETTSFLNMEARYSRVLGAI